MVEITAKALEAMIAEKEVLLEQTHVMERQILKLRSSVIKSIETLLSVTSGPAAKSNKRSVEHAEFSQSPESRPRKRNGRHDTSSEHKARAGRGFFGLQSAALLDLSAEEEDDDQEEDDQDDDQEEDDQDEDGEDEDGEDLDVQTHESSMDNEVEGQEPDVDPLPEGNDDSDEDDSDDESTEERPIQGSHIYAVPKIPLPGSRRARKSYISDDSGSEFSSEDDEIEKEPEGEEEYRVTTKTKQVEGPIRKNSRRVSSSGVVYADRGEFSESDSEDDEENQDEDGSEDEDGDDSDDSDDGENPSSQVPLSSQASQSAQSVDDDSEDADSDQDSEDEDMDDGNEDNDDNSEEKPEEHSDHSADEERNRIESSPEKRNRLSSAFSGLASLVRGSS